MVSKYTKLAYGFFIALVLKGWLFPEAVVPQSEVAIGSQVLWGILGFLFTWAAAGQWGSWKYLSPQVMAHGLNSSISTSPEEVARIGDWAVMRLGGLTVPSIGITASGREGTLVVPISAYEWMGSGILVKGKATKVAVGELPASVARYLEREGYPTPVHQVVAPVEIEEHNAAFIEWIVEDRKDNEWENTQEEVARTTQRMAEDLVNFAKRTGQNEHGLKRVLSRLEEDDDGAN